jgi:hypothetical protein
MPNLNRTQRNALRNIVTACRRLLEDETASLLEGQYGIHRTGRIEKASALRQLSSAELAYREQVLQHLRHLAAAVHGGERRVSWSASPGADCAPTTTTACCSPSLRCGS